MAIKSKQLISWMGVLVLSTVLAMSCYAMDYPDEVEIDSLASLYEGVVFDHAMHVEATEDCADCHHHTTGTQVSNEYCAKCHDGTQEMDIVSCQECHSANPLSPENLHIPRDDYNYHLDKPNLKAAYHLNCMGCHQQVAGPTGCEDCHAKTDDGEMFYHSGKYAPEKTAHESGH
ncbi:MAG: cytochrome c3 family protein [Desulfuromonadales bacterium]|nr:cytochrome c3 family protein [Desulfuromonadales bacterium]